MAAGATLRLPAALAAAVLTALIVYASLFPFEGWVWPVCSARCCWPWDLALDSPRWWPSALPFASGWCLFTAGS